MTLNFSTIQRFSLIEWQKWNVFRRWFFFFFFESQHVSEWRRRTPTPPRNILYCSDNCVLFIVFVDDCGAVRTVFACRRTVLDSRTYFTSAVGNVSGRNARLEKNQKKLKKIDRRTQFIIIDGRKYNLERVWFVCSTRVRAKRAQFWNKKKNKRTVNAVRCEPPPPHEKTQIDLVCKNAKCPTETSPDGVNGESLGWRKHVSQKVRWQFT